ncbi:glycosyltransferase family 4 protein [Verrucomicrobia bacterium]|nr:glycosyltransferase family 4 protein [Verrucomicrobiota bacterium]
MLNWRDPRNPLAGGAERVTHAYLRGLVQRGHEVTWFANAFDGGDPTEVIDGIDVIRGGGKFTAWMAARKWHATQKPFDLVIDQHHGIPWYAPIWCTDKCVAYIHEVLGPIWKAFYPWPLNRIGSWQERCTLRQYRDVPFWTASSHTRDLLHEQGIDSVTQIPYGVATRALETLPEKELDEPLQLITVSRLAPNKQVDHAIAALWSLLGEHQVEAKLKIVGQGQEGPALHRLVAELKVEAHVEFCGPLPEAEKDAALRDAHFLLHTSLREGWGLNVIEANALGTPAIVYPTPGLVESTLHRQTGLVADEESSVALAAMIAGVQSHNGAYQDWRTAARDRAATFHWDQVLPAACDQLEAWAKGDELDWEDDVEEESKFDVANDE